MNRLTWRAQAAFALAAATCFQGAQATETITFNQPELANLYGPFEEITFGEYRAYFQSDGGLIGTADDFPAATAPLGNPTPFATALNGGVFSLFRADGQAFDLLSFDFAYVPHPDSPPPQHDMVLLVLGDFGTSGGWLVDPTPIGNFFVRHDDPTELALLRNVTSISFTICSYDPQTQDVCAFTLGSAGQFALDNLVVQTPVPEPAPWLLGAAGLAALALRRRSNTQA